MKVLGLTGGIGSGKTTVAKFFEELGVPVYIADREARVLMENDAEVRRAVINLLGDESYSATLPNRKWIASQVFNDARRLQALNEIIHPAVAAHFKKWKAQQLAPYVVYEAAILFEQGKHGQCDYTLLITAPKEVRIARLQVRDAASQKEIEARMNHQWPDSKKIPLATFVIENIDVQETKRQVLNLHNRLLESA